MAARFPHHQQLQLTAHPLGLPAVINGLNHPNQHFELNNLRLKVMSFNATSPPAPNQLDDRQLVYRAVGDAIRNRDYYGIGDLFPRTAYDNQHPCAFIVRINGNFYGCVYDKPLGNPVYYFTTRPIRPLHALDRRANNHHFVGNTLAIGMGGAPEAPRPTFLMPDRNIQTKGKVFTVAQDGFLLYFRADWNGGCCVLTEGQTLEFTREQPIIHRRGFDMNRNDGLQKFLKNDYLVPPPAIAEAAPVAGVAPTPQKNGMAIFKGAVQRDTSFGNNTFIVTGEGNAILDFNYIQSIIGMPVQQGAPGAPVPQQQ